MKSLILGMALLLGASLDGYALVAPIEVTSCRDISISGNFVLARDLISPQPCLTIHDTSEVILDCSGHSIAMTTETTGNIFIGNVQNVQIVNCKTRQHKEGLGSGFTVSNSKHVQISNSDLEQLVVTDSTDVLIQNSHILGDVVLVRTTQSAVTNNIVECYPDMLVPGGVSLVDGEHNQVTGNTIDGKWDSIYHAGGSANQVGADDGITVNDEHDDLIDKNVIKNVWDAGIETVGPIVNSTISNNQITNAYVTGVGAYYGTNWTNNVVSSNIAKATPSALTITFLPLSICCPASPVPPLPTIVFQNNRIVGNNFSSDNAVGPVSSMLVQLQYTPTGGSPMPVVAAGNSISRNTLPVNAPGPVLLPPSAFQDGGGNNCGPPPAGSPITCQPPQIPADGLSATDDFLSGKFRAESYTDTRVQPITPSALQNNQCTWVATSP